MSTTILTLVGSLRAGSINRQLAEVAVAGAPEGVDVLVFDRLGEIPFYNEDIDAEGLIPESALALREAAASSDGLLLISPEYNGTMPAVLKNAIDWLSRPFGASAVSGMPTAVIGAAFGQYGGVWAQDDARKSVGIAGARVVEEVRLAIGGSVTRYADVHPKDDPETAAQLNEAVRILAEASVSVG